MIKIVRNAALVLALVLTAMVCLDSTETVEALSFPFIPPIECGEPCTVPGQEVGCVDRNSDPWRRTICVCYQGHYIC